VAAPYNLLRRFLTIFLFTGVSNSGNRQQMRFCYICPNVKAISRKAGKNKLVGNEFLRSLRELFNFAVKKKLNGLLNVQVSNLRGEAANWQQGTMNRKFKADNL